MKRVALITGGTRGIGFGIAQCLARDGFDLAVCGLRDESAAAEALAALRKLGADVLYVPADVSDAAARQRLLEAVKAALRPSSRIGQQCGRRPESARRCLGSD